MNHWLKYGMAELKLNSPSMMGLVLRACLMICITLAGNDAYGQINRYVTEGNKFYDQQKYKEAAADYAKALSRNPNHTPSMFNLGNSLYQQKQFDSSRRVMTAAEKMVKDKNGKAAANYNIGNTYMSEQKWEDAINAYKRTLRNNPQDADAKYNLSYAQQMMKKQQQNKDKNKDKDQDKKDQDKKDQDKKDQDKKDQDKKEDNKDKQDQKKEENKESKDKQEPQGQPSKLSQQQAENLLNDMQQAEKKLQDKMKKEKGTPVRMQKDW